MPSSGPDRFGQYEIIEKIASGGMAELYKAKRTGVEGFQKIVAIKKILPHLADDEEFVTMFADEAKLAAQLNHPNIIHIYDLGKIQAGGYFIAMEHVDGRDLRSIEQSGHAHSRAAPGPARRLHRLEGRLGARLRAPAARRRGPRAEHRPPRRVAAEHPHLLRRRHQALRLRHREGRLEGVEDAVGRPEGQDPVHVARAGLGKADRPPKRPLLARRRAPRAADGRAPLPRRHRHHRARKGPQRRGHPAVADEPRGADTTSTPSC